MLIQIAMYLFHATFGRNADTCSNILYVHHLFMDPMQHESTVSLLRLTSIHSFTVELKPLNEHYDAAHVVQQSSEKQYVS